MCVLPSLQGRADYHGPDVNLAARLMGAAAPGQVVTSIETAQHIFRWAGRGGSGRQQALLAGQCTLANARR